MRAPYTQLYLHLVWATWDRLPLITDEVEPHLYAAIADKCRELKCVTLAIGGVADHVHLLVRLHTTVSAAKLAKRVKGSSSHLVTHEIRPGEFFKWQGAYSAFTLRKGDVPTVQAYIERQKEHHAVGHLRDDWEQIMIPDEGQEVSVD
ncbi:MAG: IS200/IS605 family transposase [Calditrichaeota bacterium]|nr:IS200/IS605 family transposase [Calditrichota bacterium]